MLKVYKYEIEPRKYTNLTMPKGARLLHFAAQRDVPTLWVLVNPEAETESRRFLIAGTGHDIKETDHPNYVGSCLMAGDSLVWHLFELL